MYQNRTQIRSNQNLMKPVNVTAIDHGVRPWKVLIFDGLAIIFAAIFGYSFAEYLAGGISFGWVLVALLAWSAVSVILSFIQKKSGERFLVAVFETIVLLMFFYPFSWQALTITGVLVLIVLYWGYASVQRTLRNSIEIRFFAASGKMIGKVVTAAVIFMVIMYGSLANNNGNVFISQNAFNTFFGWSGELVNKIYPTIPLNSSFGEFSQSVAQMQLQGNAAFEALPQTQQNQAVADSAQQFMSGFTTSTNASTTPTSNVFYNYLSGLSSKLQDKYNDLFLGGWSLLLFLILRSIGIIVVWVGQFFALILYEILLATGFIRITEQSASQETFEY